VKSKTNVALVVPILALLALSACGSDATTTTQAVTTTLAAVTTTQAVTTTTPVVTATTQAETTTAPTSVPTAFVGVSPDSIAYAQSLGGVSHEGETLYLVIGATLDSEQQAKGMLDNAVPLFGDMQSYFIVQKSDSFEGLEPTWWVVLEAYRSEPSPENLDFDRRGFPMAYVQRATVRTSDPIPVYEDVVGG
jgi:hypothetical protein